MSVVEIANESYSQIEGRFLGFFNGQGNKYMEALGYFHSLGQEQQDFIKTHPIMKVSLDDAIDSVMYGVNEG